MTVNQTESLAHQRMWERLSERFGRSLLVTGSAFPVESPTLEVAVGPPYIRGRMAERVSSWLRFGAFAARRLARVPGHPFVLAVSNPPLNAPLVWAFHRLRGLSYGLLVWDIYPDHVVEMGWLAAGHPLVRAWRAMSRRALADAAVVITLSASMAATLRATLEARGAGRDPGGPEIEVVPNWADTRAIRPLPKAENAFARAHGLVDRLVVLYSGNLGATHGLEALVAAAGRLQESPDVAFLLVGDGLGRAPAEAEAARLGLANLRFLPAQPWETLPLSLAAGDIAVVSQTPGTEHLSLPSKVYTSLAAGSAILALTGPDTDLARLVREHDVGRVCPRDDPDSIASAIRELARQPAELTRLRVNARRAAELTFNEDAVFEQLARILGPWLGGQARAGGAARS